MSRILPRALALWIPFVIALTGVFICIYAAVQQNYRQSLNDPQIQLAEDVSAGLARGATPSFGGSIVDISTSLATWITLYSASGTPIVSTAQLNGAPPVLPAGLLNDSTWSTQKTYTYNGMKETRITWQSAGGVRQALVILHVAAPHDTYIVVGRNMREVEARISDISG